MPAEDPKKPHRSHGSGGGEVRRKRPASSGGTETHRKRSDGSETRRKRPAGAGGAETHRKRTASSGDAGDTETRRKRPEGTETHRKRPSSSSAKSHTERTADSETKRPSSKKRPASGSSSSSHSRSGSRSSTKRPADGSRPKSEPIDKLKTPKRRPVPEVEESKKDEDGALLTEDELLASQKSTAKPPRRGIAWLFLGDRSPASDDQKDIASWKKGRQIRQMIAAALVFVLIVVSGVGIYKRFINPEVLVVPAQYSGATSLQEFQDYVNNSDDEALSKQYDPSYIAKEKQYANLSQPRQEFIKAVNATVTYTVPQQQSTSIYGTPVKKHGQPLMQKSYLLNGEMVDLSTVDWSKIPVDKETVSGLMSEAGIQPTDPDIQVKLTDLYASYIVKLSNEKNGLPLKSRKWQPEMEYGTATVDGKEIPTARVSAAEDAHLDNELYSSKDLLKSMTDFSAAATGSSASPEWIDYVKNSKKGDLRPAVGNSQFIDPTWIGAWWNQKGIVENAKENNKTASPIMPALGDGTREAPAGLNTSVVTATLVPGDGGQVVAKPIRVELIDFRQDQKAFDYFQSKDSRNRGFSTQSQVKYGSMRFKVTNISDTELTIPVNATLADDQGNVINSTGSVFGMTNEVTLKPGESGIVDSWVGNTNLNQIYLIWGRDFNKQVPVVWFRVLGAKKGKISEVEDTGKLDDNSGAVSGASDGGGANG